MAKARIIDARRSTVVGTAQQIRELLSLLSGSGAALVDLRESNFVVLAKPPSTAQLREALKITPR